MVRIFYLFLIVTCLSAGIPLAHADSPAPPVLEADRHKAVIFAYHRIGDDAYPNGSVRIEQFKNQMRELKEGGYHVLSLPDVIKAFETGQDIPDQSVVITFDGGHTSIVDIAAPILMSYQFPFTVFVAPGTTNKGARNHVSWDDLRQLTDTGLVTLGIHPAYYGRLTHLPDTDIKRYLNSAVSLYREQMGDMPDFFAYPFGEYDVTYRNIVSRMGFKAAFGQHSGAAYDRADRMTLPRFNITERYGGIDRFIMAANALPLPVTDLVPEASRLDNTLPAVGFTLTPDLAAYSQNLACFVSGQRKPRLDIPSKGRVEIRLSEPIDQPRTRINCTLPGPSVAEDDDTPRWRWLGVMLTLADQNITSQEE